MKIKSNASPDELSSPFLDLNKQFCFEFEKYVAKKNGKAKGTYNAWSYIANGKISNPKNWNLMYKKSTFTSSGNLLLSSKYQTLLVMAEWETEQKGTHDSEFVIRKKTSADFFKIPFSKSLSKLKFFKKYVIKVEGNKPKIFSEIIKILGDLF